MATINEVTASTNQTRPVKTNAAKRPVPARKTLPIAGKAKAAAAPTKVTETQVRKAESPSVRNIASPKQTSAVLAIKMSKKKMERDSFTMPKEEYVQFSVLKKRLEDSGQSAKKSELIRAGIKQLSDMTDAQLKRALLAVPVIKTGRPKKKK